MADQIGYWNAHEDAALQSLSLEAQIIYLRRLRRYANKGGIAGVTPRFNMQSFIEICEFTPEPRSRAKPVKLTAKQVYARIDELVRAGLVERRPDIGPLVFFLPLAVEADFSAQNLTEDRTAQKSAIKPTTCELINKPQQHTTPSPTDELIVNIFNNACAYFDAAGKIAFKKMPVNQVANLVIEVLPGANFYAALLAVESQNAATPVLNPAAYLTRVLLNQNTSQPHQRTVGPIARDWLPSADQINRIAEVTAQTPGDVLMAALEFRLEHTDKKTYFDNAESYFAAWLVRRPQAAMTV